MSALTGEIIEIGAVKYSYENGLLIRKGIFSRDIKPVIIFTKSDLNEDDSERLCSVYTKAGYEVLVSAPQKPLTKSDLKNIIGEGIAAFAGPSGVGKSTLCNSLLGFDLMQTGEVSAKIKRGRHTTRHVELHEFFEGFICDTPGFTSLDMPGMEPRAVRDLSRNSAAATACAGIRTACT